jgi:flagellar basal-body rod modification protein FlgD
MDLSAIAASDPSAFGAAAGLPTQALDKTAFMELLVAQLQNQDPLEPASNEEFIGQLASFSSLEQLENLNDNFMTMVLLNQSNALLGQMTEGSALIGQTVSWLDPTTGEGGTGVVDSVKIVDGTAFLSVDGQDIALIDVTEVEGQVQEDGGGEEPPKGGDDEEEG